MVEIFYKTYYYIFNIFFDYYCIYLLHRNYSFEAVLWKTKENAVERLLKSYRRFYNITRFDGGISPPLEEGRNLREAVKLSPFREDERNGLAAVCEYYEKQASTYFSNPMKSGPPIRKSSYFFSPPII